MPTHTVLILSARGFGNIGDDLVAEMARSIVLSLLPDADVRFGTLPFVRAEIEWADTVMLGGGGLLYDSDVDNINNYLEPLAHAAYMKKKIVLLGVGTQKIASSYGRLRYREILDKADLICVRDTTDFEVLKTDCGVTAPVHVTADLGFCLPQFAVPSDAVRAGVVERIRQFARGEPVTAMSIVNSAMWSDETSVESRSLAELARRVIAKQAKTVFLVHSSDDKGFYDSLADKHGKACLSLTIDDPSQSTALMDVYREFDTVVTSRYHAMVLAVLTRRKLVLLNSQTHKIDRAVRDFFPSLREAVRYYKDVHSPEGQSAFMAAISQGVVVSEDDANSAVVAANRNLEYLRSFFYGLDNA